MIDHTLPASGDGQRGAHHYRQYDQHRNRNQHRSVHPW